MDVDTGSRVFQMKLLAVFLFVAVFVAVSVFGLEVETSPANAVVSVQEEVRAGNLGTSHVFSVELENGSTLSYENYTSHHPLCPEQPEKCGEDSVDPGWNEIKKALNSSAFREIEENFFKASGDICMASRTSFREC